LPLFLNLKILNKMKNVFLFISGVLAGLLAFFMYNSVIRSSDCEICIRKDQIAKVYPGENIADLNLDGETLLVRDKFIGQVNSMLTNISTVRISDKFAESIIYPCDTICKGLTPSRGVSFQFAEILKGLMSSQSVSDLGQLDIRLLESVGFTTVFAKYSDNKPPGWDQYVNQDFEEYKSKRTAFIQLVERGSDGKLQDVRDASGSDYGNYYRYNVGRVCPNDCPTSLRLPTDPE